MGPVVTGWTNRLGRGRGSPGKGRRFRSAPCCPQAAHRRGARFLGRPRTGRVAHCSAGQSPHLARPDLSIKNANHWLGVGRLGKVSDLKRATLPSVVHLLLKFSLDWKWPRKWRESRSFRIKARPARFAASLRF